jgi:hypothetical protein
MIKLLLVLILSLLSTSVMAEWDLIASSEDGDLKVYADKSNILKTDNNVKMWVLYDYNTVKESAGDKYLSQKYLTEHDCKNKRSRILALTMYSGIMLTGDVIFSNESPFSWTDVVPNTIGENTWKLACGEKS